MVVRLCGAGLGLVSHDGFRLTGNEAVGWRGGEGFGLTGGKEVLLGSRIYVRRTIDQSIA